MNKVAIFIFKGFTRLLAVLPAPLLYAFSSMLAFLLYHVLRYRRKVVRNNLLLSFPEMDIRFIWRTEKQFYRNLSDIILESSILLYSSKTRVRNTIRLTNPELIDSLYNNGRSFFLAVGHSGNWELLAAYMSVVFRHESIAIYKRISSGAVDKLMQQIRKAVGGILLFESKQAYKQLVAGKDRLRSVLILGDQNPAGLETDYWTNFLHRDTAFFNGLAKMANSLDYAVLYADFVRVARGKYEISLIPVRMPDEKPGEQEISERYVRLLENSIRKQPDNWLWSHRRWKHSRKPQHI